MVQIYKENDENGNKRILSVYINNDNHLVLEGNDYGPIVKDTFQSSSYEFFYTFNTDETEKMRLILECEDIKELPEKLNKMYGNKSECFDNIKKLAEDNNIKYEFGSWFDWD